MFGLMRPVLASPNQSCHDVSVSTPDLRRLADRVVERRKGLNLSIKRAAALAPMSKDTWIRVEAGKQVQNQTYDKVELVLHWTVGSCRKVLDGGDPMLLPDSEAQRITPVPKEDLAEAEIRDAVQGALISTTDDLTSSEIRSVNERAIEILRDRGVLPPKD
jgi:transcriptional regulator with XRE-family HTH domain